MSGWEKGKKQLFIKITALIMAQAFFVSSLGYAEGFSGNSLRIPIGLGKDRLNAVKNKSGLELELADKPWHNKRTKEKGVNIWQWQSGGKARLIKSLVLSRDNKLTEPEQYDGIREQTAEILKLRAEYLFNFVNNKLSRLETFLVRNARNKRMEGFVKSASEKAAEARGQLSGLENKMKDVESIEDILGIIIEIKALSAVLKYIAVDTSSKLKPSNARADDYSMAAQARDIARSIVLQEGAERLTLESPRFIEKDGGWMVEVRAAGGSVYFNLRNKADDIRTWHFKITGDSQEVLVASPEEIGIIPNAGPGTWAPDEAYDIGQLAGQLAQLDDNKDAPQKDALRRILINEIKALKDVWQFSRLLEDTRIAGGIRGYMLDQALGRMLIGKSIDDYYAYFQDIRIGDALKEYLGIEVIPVIRRSFPTLEAVKEELQKPRCQGYLKDLILSRRDSMVSSANIPESAPLVQYWKDFKQEDFGPLIRRKDGDAIKIIAEKTKDGIAQYKIKLKKGDEILCPIEGSRIMESAFGKALILNCGGLRRITVRSRAPLELSNHSILEKWDIIGGLKYDAEITVIFWNEPGIDKGHSMSGMDAWIRAVSLDGTEIAVSNLSHPVLATKQGQAMPSQKAEETKFAPAPLKQDLPASVKPKPAPAVNNTSQVLGSLLTLLEQTAIDKNWNRAIEIAYEVLTADGIEGQGQSDRMSLIQGSFRKYFIPALSKLAKSSEHEYYLRLDYIMPRLNITVSRKTFLAIMLLLENVHEVVLFRILGQDMILPITDEIRKDSHSLADAWKKEAKDEPEDFKAARNSYNEVLLGQDKSPIRGVGFLKFFYIWKESIGIYFSGNIPGNWQEYIGEIEKGLRKVLEDGALTGQMAVLPPAIDRLKPRKSPQPVERHPVEIVQKAVEDTGYAQPEPVAGPVTEEPLPGANHIDAQYDRPFISETFAKTLLQIREVESALDENGPDLRAVEEKCKLSGFNVDTFHEKFQFFRPRLSYACGPYVKSGSFFLGPKQIEILFSALHSAWIDKMNGIAQAPHNANYIDYAADALMRAGWNFDKNPRARHEQIVHIISSVNKTREGRWFQDCLYYMDLKLIRELEALRFNTMDIAVLINRGPQYIENCLQYSKRLSGASMDMDFFMYAAMAYQTAAITYMPGAAETWFNNEGRALIAKIQADIKDPAKNIVLVKPAAIWENHILRELQNGRIINHTKTVYFAQSQLAEIAVVDNVAYFMPFFSLGYVGIPEKAAILEALKGLYPQAADVVILPWIYNYDMRATQELQTRAAI